MTYDDPGCAYCLPSVRACRQGESEDRVPGFCPTKVDPDTLATGRALYDDPEVGRIACESDIIERRNRIKKLTIQNRRLNHQRQAA